MEKPQLTAEDFDRILVRLIEDNKLVERLIERLVEREVEKNAKRK